MARLVSDVRCPGSLRLAGSAALSVASFTLPIPPSLNNIFFSRPHGGRAKTTDYKNWLETAAWEIRSQRVPTIDGDIRVELVIERPNKSSDIDNRIKPVLDCMQKAGVVSNDKAVVEIRAKWGDVKGCKVTVYTVAA